MSKELGLELSPWMAKFKWKSQPDEEIVLIGWRQDGAVLTLIESQPDESGGSERTIVNLNDPELRRVEIKRRRVS